MYTKQILEIIPRFTIMVLEGVIFFEYFQPDSEPSVRSSVSSQHSIPQIQVSDDIQPKSLDEQSIGKKSVSTISLSSISKSFSRKSHVSNFASSVRRKFSENQGKNLMKSVLGE
jgi:hypothetical protein